ncbi:MAG: hypothetical protein LBC87_00145 [Fibromonadaceae bacterium]|jgi:uncharacterized membrane protein|nr:hypothetical protein [Fibromonadaceae bacterium]
MSKKMTKKSEIIARIVLVIVGLVLIFINLSETGKLKKLRRSGNYEYGVVTEVSYHRGGGRYGHGTYSVYFMSGRGYGKCEISQRGFLGFLNFFNLFEDSPRDRYKIGDRVQLAFNDSGSYCASSDDIGKILSSCRIQIVFGLILVFGGMFIKSREQPDNAS